MTTKDSGKEVVIITGAGGGIGLETCRLFAGRGADVVAIDVDGTASRRAAELAREFGANALAIEADVVCAKACARIAERAMDAFGRIDVLFNNAGVTVRQDVVHTTEEQWDRVLGVNLKSVFLMSRAVIPHMEAAGGGVIVNTASGWGINGGARAAAYCASKGGVVLLTKAMAIDHGPSKVRVNCVCPGDTETGMLLEEARQLGLEDNQLVKDAVQRPLGRVGQPHDIASAVVFLASKEASFITGTSLVVDGGGLAGSA